MYEIKCKSPKFFEVSQPIEDSSKHREYEFFLDPTLRLNYLYALYNINLYIFVIYYAYKLLSLYLLRRFK